MRTAEVRVRSSWTGSCGREVSTECRGRHMHSATVFNWGQSGGGISDRNMLIREEAEVAFPIGICSSEKRRRRHFFDFDPTNTSES